jgi:UDP-N-acetyl-D-glucosamine dehydrogenase
MSSDIKLDDKSEVILRKIQSKDIKVGIIGLGYVGLPLAVEFANQGIDTIGFEVDDYKINKLNAGENYIEDLDDIFVNSLLVSGKLKATKDVTKLSECDAVFICVPTPFTDNKDPDIRYIINSARSLSDNMKPGAVVILKSTTFPGTTEKYVMPILERADRKVGVDYYLAFSPERIDPGNKKWTT